MTKVISNRSVFCAMQAKPPTKKESEQSLEEQIKPLTPVGRIQMISELISSKLVTVEEALDLLNPERKIERELKKTSLGKELF